MRRTGLNAALSAPSEGAGPPHSDRLVILALAVLDDALEQAKRGRVAPSPALRLALAYLYRATRRRGDQHGPGNCETFWKWAVTQNAPTDGSGGAYGGYRKGNLEGPFARIAAGAGAPLTPEVLAAIRSAREGENKMRRA